MFNISYILVDKLPTKKIRTPNSSPKIYNNQKLSNNVSEDNFLIIGLCNDLNIFNIFTIKDNQIISSILLNFESEYKDYDLDEFKPLIYQLYNKTITHGNHNKYISNTGYYMHKTNVVNFAKLCIFNEFIVSEIGIQLKYINFVNGNKYKCTGRISFKKNILEEIKTLITNINILCNIDYDTRRLLSFITNEPKFVTYNIHKIKELDTLKLDCDYYCEPISNLEIDDIVKLLIIYTDKYKSFQSTFVFDNFRFKIRYRVSLEFFGNDLGELNYSKTSIGPYNRAQRNCFEYLKQKNLIEHLKQQLQFEILRST